MRARGKFRRVQQQSDREREFLTHWIELGGPRLEAQHAFHPTRRWKFDWAHPESRVAIEVHGGTWMHKSRHVTGAGFWGDRIKMNAALRLNWKVFELISDDLTNRSVYDEIIDEIERRISEAPLPCRDGMAPFEEVYPDRQRRARQYPRAASGPLSRHNE
jgi:hypothetical protein